MPKEKPLVLIVDDEVDLANNIAEIIRESGRYTPLVANNAKDAMNILMDNGTILGLLPNRVKLVILDIKMPEVDGLQFLEMLREQRATGKIGVIMLTAFEDDEKWAKARKGEVAGYMLKPFNGTKLMAQIDRFFAGKERWMIEEAKWETLTKAAKAKLEKEEKEKNTGKKKEKKPDGRAKRKL